MRRRDIPFFIEAFKRLREEATDEQALASVFAFAEWKTETDYGVGDRIRHGESLYRCVQAHTSQDGWTPDATPALWTRISLDEFPEWVQPLGSEDAYRIGDKVSHNGKHWVCTMDFNVYEPSVYGWDEVTEWR